jgi:hypothetical protein
LATSSPAGAGAAGREVVVHLPLILAEIAGRAHSMLAYRLGQQTRFVFEDDHHAFAKA